MNRDEINARLKRVNVKGRDYIEVNQRILAFWELYPDGRIITEKLSDDGSRCDFRATAYNGDTPIATGHAFEFQGAGVVNKTSYLENCETSAVGRALGILGIGITESIASADEVISAIDHQERGEQPDPEKALHDAQQILLEAEKEYCASNGIDDWKVFHHDVVRKRPDYENTVGALKSIAEELREAS